MHGWRGGVVCGHLACTHLSSLQLRSSLGYKPSCLRARFNCAWAAYNYNASVNGKRGRRGSGDVYLLDSDNASAVLE